MIGALALIERYPDEARVACLRYGRSVDDIGTEAFPWMDAVAIFATTQPGDPLYDAVNRDEAGWGLTEMLLASILDALNIIIWQGGKRRRGDFPRPTPRPGVDQKDERRFGDEAIEIEDMQTFLDRKRAGDPPA